MKRRGLLFLHGGLGFCFRGGRGLWLWSSGRLRLRVRLSSSTAEVVGLVSSALAPSTHPPTNLVLSGGECETGGGSEAGAGRGIGGTWVFPHLDGAEGTHLIRSCGDVSVLGVGVHPTP